MIDTVLGGDIYLATKRICARKGHTDAPCSICLMKLLGRYHAVFEAAQVLQREIYPRDVFVGCDECDSGLCACDRGVQIARSLGDSLDRVNEEL